MLNRNRSIQLFVGNASNAVLHEILMRAIENSEITNKYAKEIKNSFEIARKYREKINPADMKLPDKDVESIKRKIVNKVKAELLIRIEKGYSGIDINIVEKLVEEFLREMRIL